MYVFSLWSLGVNPVQCQICSGESGTREGFQLTFFGLPPPFITQSLLCTLLSPSSEVWDSFGKKDISYILSCQNFQLHLSSIT
jgi:hypothetical protein